MGVPVVVVGAFVLSRSTAATKKVCVPLTKRRFIERKIAETIGTTVPYR